jgi:hypothetical protein
MQKRVLFADANVFLHCTFFTEVDWRTLADGNEVVLTLCPAVVGELDRKKFADSSPRVRERAKKVVKRMSELVADDQPVRFREGCWLWLTCREPKISARDVVDDVILASAVEHHESGDDVVLVSIDMGMRLKAASRKLSVVTIPDEWRLSDEPDEREREIRKLEKENATLRAALPKLQLTFAGSPVIELPFRSRRPLAPDVIEQKVATARKKYPFEKFSGFDNLKMGLVLGYVTDEQREKYNHELEEYFETLRLFYQLLPKICARQDQTIELIITVDNVGTQSADEVDVLLTANAAGRWRRKLPRREVPFPKPPKPPEPRRLAGVLDDDLIGRMNLKNLNSFRPVGPRENVEAVPLDGRHPTRAEFNVRLIKAGSSVALPPRFFEFESFEAVKSFSIDYRLVGKNMRAPTDGQLHVRIRHETGD